MIDIKKRIKKKTDSRKVALCVRVNSGRMVGRT